jgi:hypothetical protein
MSTMLCELQFLRLVSQDPRSFVTVVSLIYGGWYSVVRVGASKGGVYCVS